MESPYSTENQRQKKGMKLVPEVSGLERNTDS